MSMLPASLQSAMEDALTRMDHATLKACAQQISERYRTESGRGKRLLTTYDEAAAYALVRMPATYGAVEAALSWSMQCCDLELRNLLDCGAGSGAASWAAS